MNTLPEMYRIALSPFRPGGQAVHSVVGGLVPHGFLPHQLCLMGTATGISVLANTLDPSSAGYPELQQLIGKLEPVQAPHATVPALASAGPITDVLLRHKSWLCSPAATGINQRMQRGDVVLAVNGLDHEQFVTAARMLLRHGHGNVATEIFNWPTYMPGR